MKGIEDIKNGSISTSALKEASKSIRHLVWYKNKPRETKLFLDFGNACELYCIDRKEFSEKVAVFDDSEKLEEIGGAKPRGTTAYREWKDVFEQENVGKYIIPKFGVDSLEVIEKLYDLYLQNPMAVSCLEGNYQLPFEWTCEQTGLSRYSRTDIFNAEKKFITDVKTDGKGDFSKACANNDYYFQALDQINGAIGSGLMESVDNYYWVVFTKTPPFGCDVFELELDQILKVEEKYSRTLNRVFECETEPVFISGEVTRLNPPGYYK